MKYDILTYGSITLDTFLSPEKPLEQGKNFIIPIGEKILLKKVSKSCGGSSANSSVGFAKLGLKTGTFGFIGDDRVGTSIKSIFEEEGLNTEFLTESVHSESSMSVILNTQDGQRSVLNYRNPMEDFDPEHLHKAPKTRALYIGHLTEKSQDFLFAIPEWKKDTQTLITWNPGKTQFRKGFSYFEKLFPCIDVLILNKEEAEEFSGLSAKKLKYSRATDKEIGKKINIYPEYKTDTIYDMREVFEKFLSAGVKKIVITDSRNGAQMFDNKGNHFRVPAPDVKIESTLGAGDAFSVGIVSSILYHQATEKQLLWGAWSSGFVIQEFGAQHGQATREEIEARISL